MLKSFVFAAFLIVSSTICRAEDFKKHEIGILTGIVYSIADKYFDPEVNIDYCYIFNPGRYSWSIFMGMNTILNKGSFSNIGIDGGLDLSVLIFKGLDFSVGAGLFYSGKKNQPGVYTSVSYLYELPHFLLGHIVEYSYVRRGRSIMAGIFIGFGF